MCMYVWYAIGANHSAKCAMRLFTTFFNYDKCLWMQYKHEIKRKTVWYGHNDSWIICEIILYIQDTFECIKTYYCVVYIKFNSLNVVVCFFFISKNTIITITIVTFMGNSNETYKLDYCHDIIVSEFEMWSVFNGVESNYLLFRGTLTHAYTNQ